MEQSSDSERPVSATARSDPSARRSDRDVLSDLLATLRVSGGRYRASELGAPWGITFGVRRVATFHALLRGVCWLRVDSHRFALGEGDLVILLDGREHTLSDRPFGPAVRVDFDERPGRALARCGGPGPTSLLVCGEIEIVEAGSHPLLSSLPRLIHLPSSTGPNDVLGATLALIEMETARPRAGTATVVARLAEALFVQAVRLWVERERAPTGWIAAQRDPRLARVIAAMHDTPARGWSLPALAKIGGMSRTVLAERFQHIVGEPPVRYLSRLRMHLAARALLERPDDTIDEIAARVGYRSSAAFARAFRRFHGVGPRTLRLRRHAVGDGASGSVRAEAATEARRSPTAPPLRSSACAVRDGPDQELSARCLPARTMDSGR